MRSRPLTILLVEHSSRHLRPKNNEGANNKHPTLTASTEGICTTYCTLQVHQAFVWHSQILSDVLLDAGPNSSDGLFCYHLITGHHVLCSKRRHGCFNRGHWHARFFVLVCWYYEVDWQLLAGSSNSHGFSGIIRPLSTMTEGFESPIDPYSLWCGLSFAWTTISLRFFWHSEVINGF